MTIDFTRARSEEQRAQRRARILAVAARLVAESRIGDLSLNELARQVGLAKSNVLRYFPSREAVLLAVHQQVYAEWLDALAEELGSPTKPAGADELAAVIARTAAERPVLCELIANAALVLEHNVSGEVAADYKRGALAHAERLVTLASEVLGELDGEQRLVVAGGVNVALGGAWAVCRPSPGMREAYRRYPELSAFELEFEPTARALLAALLRGVLRG